MSHAETIAVAIAKAGGEMRSVGIIPNRLESIRKLMGKWGSAQHLKVCYEAGPTGYVLYCQLTALGVACEVVAPTWTKKYLEWIKTHVRFDQPALEATLAH